MPRSAAYRLRRLLPPGAKWVAFEILEAMGLAATKGSEYAALLIDGEKIQCHLKVGAA